jgi:hypothetical protein
MAVVAPTRTISAEDGASQTDSARRAGGPQDKALYECSCGTVFTAAVSTSVDCPVCGDDQAW